MKQNPATAIKCKFSNEVHKLLEPNIDIKARMRWQHRDKYQLTDKQKLEIIDKIIKLHSECSNELTHYKFERREKRRIQKERIARGYKFKTKVKKPKNVTS